jgi:hypothetical protein
MDGISNPFRAWSAAPLLLLSGCFPSLQGVFGDEGRLLLQVHEGLGERHVEDVDVAIFSHGRVVARAKTNGIGCVGLDFWADELSFESSMKPHESWIVIRLEKPGYATTELPLRKDEFIVLKDRRLLTRGVALRRAS